MDCTLVVVAVSGNVSCKRKGKTEQKYHPCVSSFWRNFWTLLTSGIHYLAGLSVQLVAVIMHGGHVGDGHGGHVEDGHGGHGRHFLLPVHLTLGVTVHKAICCVGEQKMSTRW